MAFTSPPPAPQRGDRATFSGRVDAFLLWLVGLIPQLNAFLSSITALAAGGANSFVYTFDTDTADSDPGAGKLRLGSSTQNTAVVMRIDNLAGNGGDVTAFLMALAAGTSNVKASVRLQKVGDATTYLLFDITGVTNASGYLNLTLLPRTSTSGSPFASNDTLAVFFDPKGDRGDGGNTPTQAEIISAVGTLPIASGGTGATTAPVALQNLGALPIAGGNMSGPITFPNNTTSIRIKDAGGTARNYLSLGSDGWLNTYNSGGTGVRIFSQDGNTLLQTVDSLGNVDMAGNLTLNNTRSVRLRDGAGNPRSIVLAGSDNWLNYYGMQTGTRWWNSVGNAVIASLSDAGLFSANVVAETSDERKKKNWRVLTDVQLDALAELEKVGVFDWVNGSGTALGASAQAIQAIVPEAVHTDEHGELSVAYSGLTFAMAHGALRRAMRK